jgi:exodeoxyribonuclease VII large subunit
MGGTMQQDTATNAYTVSQVNAVVKELIETTIGTIWVSGEISNFRRQASGHLYFTLKDSSAQIKCVMWRSSASRLGFSPEDGMQMLVRGHLTMYEAYGQYQLVASYLQPAGVGDLQRAFEELKTRLSEEGLFDAARKHPLPALPRVIGVVTSGTGAALRDIINVITRRMPTTRIVVRPTVVQGATAAEDIEQAIGQFNRMGETDLLIIGRGGGSLEDLWCFNEERVVRAIADSRIPVISAVGHEIDFTLSDFAADLRAPTPSAAAEIAVPDRSDIVQRLAGLHSELVTRTTRRLDRATEKVQNLWSRDAPRLLLDRIDRTAQDIDRHTETMGHRVERIVTARRSRLSQLTASLDALSPLRILSRGFAVCERETDGRIVTIAADVDPGDRIRLRLHRGMVFGVVESRIG